MMMFNDFMMCVCICICEGLLRCGKSCRLRWINYLRADVKRGNFTTEEEEIIVKLHAVLGNRCASALPNQKPFKWFDISNTHP